MKFFHIADLHIGFPLKSGEDNFDYGKVLQFIKEKGEEFGVDLVVIAGDIFHRRDPDPYLQTLFAQFVSSVITDGIEVLIVTGNHDGALFRERSIHFDVYRMLHFPHIYISKRPEVFKIKGVNFITLPYPFKQNILSKEEYREKSEEEVLNILNSRLMSIIDKLLLEVGDGRNVLVGHIPISEGIIGSEQYINFARDPTLSLEELDRKDLDYFALGHLHKRQVHKSKKYGHLFVYPGSLDRIDFGEEGDEKGFYVVEISHDGSINLNFIENPYARSFYTIYIKDDASFDSIDMEKARHSITRIVVQGEIENEMLLANLVKELTKTAYAFAGIEDRRVPMFVPRDAVYEFRDPIKAVREYIDKTGDERIKKLKEKIIAIAEEIFLKQDET